MTGGWQIGGLEKGCPNLIIGGWRSADLSEGGVTKILQALVQLRPHLHSTWFREKAGALPVCKSAVALITGCGLNCTSTSLRWDSFWDREDPSPLA